MEFNGKTKLICLLGSPIAHSMSPQMHNKAFELLHLDYCYLAFDVDENGLADAVKGLKTIGARGWNLTMPDKTKMCELVDELSSAAEIIGAVNTVVNDNGRLTGHITDGTGFMTNLKKHHIDVIGRKIVLCGAGGAARAIAVQAALDGVKEIVIFNRSANKAERLADTINDHTSCRASAYALADQSALKSELSDAALFVNGTKLGMHPKADTCVLEDFDMLSPETAVADIVYNPRKTKLLTLAEARGCQIVGGLGMLMWQGAHAFKIWTGCDMPVEAIRKEYFE